MKAKKLTKAQKAAKAASKPANLVAKHMNTFNRSSVEAHKKGKAKRGESKHRVIYR